MNKNYVFDFDGVICDSTNECLVSSWNAWQTWTNRSNFRKKISEFSQHEINRFKILRPRVRGAGEYYVLCRSFEDDIKISNQESYDKLAITWKKDILEFKKTFFNSREDLRKYNLNEWIDLHEIYEDVMHLVKRIHAEKRLFIATLKDARSVQVILKKKGLMLPKENILDQSKIKTKLEALELFRDKISCTKDEMIFLDDNATHLIQPKAHNYTVYLTTWGPTIKEYIKIAKEHSIPTIKKSSALLK